MVVASLAGMQAATKPAATDPVAATPFVVVLGIAQDAGYPQAGCEKECCAVPVQFPIEHCGGRRGIGQPGALEQSLAPDVPGCSY